MTDKELQEIADRCEETTPGPWSTKYSIEGQFSIVGACDREVTPCRQDIPALLAEIKRIRAVKDEFFRVLGEIDVDLDFILYREKKSASEALDALRSI